MRPKRHANATTTPTMRMAIQEGFESDRARARRMGLNRKTIAKWKRRKTTLDEPSGPKAPHALRLDPAEEDFVVHYRLVTRLTLNDCLVRLREVFPSLSRSALHRCLKRRSVGRFRRAVTAAIAKDAERYIPGHFWISAHRAPPAESNGEAAALFAAIEMKTGRAFCRRLAPTLEQAGAFLERLSERIPVKVVVTRNDDELFAPNEAELLLGKSERGALWRPFARMCRQKGIDHWADLPDAKRLFEKVRPRKYRRRKKPRDV